ncbi:DUF3783 domain-containing protein [Clostridium cochlearium]|jgi:hypothetical protein|uniref:DUF3783 domain-containing protein n=1 Tax=Clostridium cochlearium TaxID=1494 RepID=A0A240B4B6_CLOCO|nr:DUF3783 domain-containing protein [Clostridium cochlearium]MBV1816672.1 DUF3783 domain-containing protein [Bacteroidales bacterium MSK.15.36]NSJ90507.1 DUF3783 domain-containing protein [Coprococcus sp. MSK.21.13]MBE6065577.1 DUF3783 domain-containing protein [Clostridium cochlearium]MBU5270044.1 DUF3783 domain-containing protein [Clostridium cochlearium]MCG4571280.1 DUF3783 domain-containing protein [Clostridium cochlearium]
MSLRPKILFYGFSTTDLMKLNIKYDIVNIDKQMESMTVKDILEVNKSKNVDKDEKEKIILFNDLKDKELNNIIPIIRENLGKEPILAVVTPISINWVFSDLKKELLKEREYFNSVQSRRGEK